MEAFGWIEKSWKEIQINAVLFSILSFLLLDIVGTDRHLLHVTLTPDNWILIHETHFQVTKISIQLCVINLTFNKCLFVCVSIIDSHIFICLMDNATEPLNLQGRTTVLLKYLLNQTKPKTNFLLKYFPNWMI